VTINQSNKARKARKVRKVRKVSKIGSEQSKFIFSALFIFDEIAIFEWKQG